MAETKKPEAQHRASEEPARTAQTEEHIVKAEPLGPVSAREGGRPEDVGGARPEERTAHDKDRKNC